jgi:hypothetical protein
MGVKSGPRIVKDGLVFDLDAAVSRSYSGSGLTANGLVGGLGGTLVNGVGFTSANNGSFIFDGTNDFVNCSNFLDDPSNFTITVWHKCTLRFYQFIVAKVNDVDAGPGWAMHAGDYIWGVAAFSQTNATNWKLFYTGKMVDDGIWHHLVAVYVNKIVTGIYVDGISYPFTTLSDGIVTSMSNPLNVRIGTNQTNEYMFRGNISQVQLYNRALTAQEILQNYNATKGRYI